MFQLRTVVASRLPRSTRFRVEDLSAAPAPFEDLFQQSHEAITELGFVHLSWASTRMDPADIAGIDTAMQLGANHPMGPLSLADYIGLDIVCAMTENLYSSFGHEYMAPPEMLKKLVSAGNLGRKTKLGFYDYSQRPPVPNGQLG